MRKDKNIDELFREKLVNYEQEPPAYLLESILDRVEGARRKRRIVFWRVAGVAAALLLAFVAGWQLKYINNGTVNQTTIVSQNSSPEMKKAIPVVPEVNTSEANVLKNENSYIETSGKAEPNRNFAFAGQPKLQETKTSPETIINKQAEGSSVLRPLKTLTRLMSSNDQFANVLHDMKVNVVVSGVDQLKLTMDQQIIEQNYQELLAQNENQKKVRWMVGAQVSPAYNVSRSNHSPVYASNMLSASANPVDLGGGFSVEYKKGKRWSLQSGVYYAGLAQSSGNTSYSNRNLSLSPSSDYASNQGSEYFNAPVNVDSRSSKMMMNSAAGVIEFSGVPSGIVLGTNLEDKSLASAVVVSDARFIQNFEYIEIPLYLRYTIVDSRFDVEMMGGFSSNLLIGNETFMESADGKSSVGKTKDMETMNYSGTLGLGFKYGLSKRIFLNVEPRVKYYLNSLNGNSSVSYKPYTIGVYTGLSYEF